MTPRERFWWGVKGAAAAESIRIGLGTLLSGSNPTQIAVYLESQPLLGWIGYAGVAMFVLTIGGWISEAWEDDHKWKCAYFGGTWQWFVAWFAAHYPH